MYCGFLSSCLFLFLAVLFGVLSCFWGYRAFKVVLGIVGFAGGAYLGAGAGAYFTGGFGIVAVITGLIGGLIGAALVSVVYYAGIFVLGALGGWVIYTMIAGAAGYGPHLILLIVLALIGGILALFFQKFLIGGDHTCSSCNVDKAWIICVTGCLDHIDETTLKIT